MNPVEEYKKLSSELLEAYAKYQFVADELTWHIGPPDIAYRSAIESSVRIRDGLDAIKDKVFSLVHYSSFIKPEEGE